MKAIFCKIIQLIRTAFQAITKRVKTDVRIDIDFKESQVTLLIDKDEEEKENVQTSDKSNSINS